MPTARFPADFFEGGGGVPYYRLCNEVQVNKFEQVQVVITWDPPPLEQTNTTENIEQQRTFFVKDSFPPGCKIGTGWKSVGRSQKRYIAAAIVGIVQRLDGRVCRETLLTSEPNKLTSLSV